VRCCCAGHSLVFRDEAPHAGERAARAAAVAAPAGGEALRARIAPVLAAPERFFPGLDSGESVVEACARATRP